MLVLGPLGTVSPRAWVVGDLVVARVAMDKLKAFGALDGNEAWEMELKTGTARSYCVPIVDSGVLYVCEGNSVSAIDLAGRKRLWSQELASCACLVRGGAALVCVAGDKVVGLDAGKGDKLWDADLPSAGNAPGNLPFPMVLRGSGMVADDAHAYLLVGDQMTSFDLKKGGTKTAKLDLSLPSSDGDDATTSGPPAIPNAPVGFAVSSRGAGISKWTASGGTLFVGNVNGLFAFEGKTGQRLWAMPLKQRINSDPVASGGVIYFGTVRSGGAAAGETTPPSDLPGLHALKPPASTTTKTTTAPMFN
jgi:outer membrane protein assembly factor BamB